MKIEKLKIRNYGPIKELVLKPNEFQLIFGINESGKTALVEALSYVLFKKNPLVLRYGKPEDITLEIENNGTIYTLPTKKMKLPLPASEISNVMYVQASESSVFGTKGQTSFWDGIKSIFSKIGSGMTFARLDEKIFKVVGLTPRKAEWVEEKKDNIEVYEKRKEQLEAYLQKINDIEKKEAILAQSLDRRKTLKRQLTKIETSRNYKNYKEISSLYTNYLEKKTELQSFERYKYDYLTTWQQLELKRQKGRKDEERLKEITTEIENAEKDIVELKRNQDVIDIKGVKQYLIRTQQKTRKSPFIYPSIILAASVVLSIVLFFTVGFIPAAALFAIGLVFAAYGLYKGQADKKLTTRRDEILAKAKKVFPDLSNLDELADKIELIQETILKKETLVEVKKKDLTRLYQTHEMTRIDRALGEIRSKTGLAELSDLKNKIHKKQNVENEMSNLGGRIAGMLYEQNDNRWKGLIEKMKTNTPVEEADISMEQELRTELKKLEARINELTHEVHLFNEIQRKTHNITDIRSAFVELDGLKRRLKDHELEKNAALEVRKILQQMSSDLDTIIDDIMQGSKSLSRYFALVTDRYEQVNIKNKDFVVRNKKGKEFAIDELSSGTRDQLFICFRLAALKKMYPEGAFLILDDAFIFADWSRRQKLVELLKEFVDQGNQIIYLTSDDHTRDLLKKYGAQVTTL